MKKIWSFFSSIKLTIVIVVLICIDAAWGSILSMRYPGFYRALDQKILFPWLIKAGTDYLHFTLWIYILIFLTALFAVNTLVCTADKVWAIIKSKMPWQSFFPHIVHIGLMVALLGHLAGSTAGFRSSGNILFTGEPAPVPHEEGLSVRLDNLDMKPSPSGELESLETKVTLLKDNKEILTGVIRINGPLIYKGIAFYHLDQGRMPSGLRLDVEGEKLSVSFNRAFKTSDGSGFRFGEVYPDFAMDENGNAVSRSNEFVNPYIEIISDKGGKAFLNISNPGASTSVGGKTFRFEDYIVAQYVILAINRDPGIWLIITGSAILVAGMVLLLFFRGERSELVRQKN